MTEAWRSHFIEQLAGLVDADMGNCGESAGPSAMEQRSLGVIHWGNENCANPAAFGEVREMIEQNPMLYELLFRYFERLVRDDGVCHSRREIISDREWYPSTSYQGVHRPLGVDHVVWCFQSIAHGAVDEFSGVMIYRAAGGTSAREPLDRARGTRRRGPTGRRAAGPVHRPVATGPRPAGPAGPWLPTRRRWGQTDRGATAFE